MRLNEVRLYTLLYAAFFGLVSQPQPLGARSPSAFLIIRLGDVRAAIILDNEGFRILNFMEQIFSDANIEPFIGCYTG